jgi:hypothetical protein
MSIPIFARRAEKYFPDYYSLEQSILLRTIKMPKPGNNVHLINIFYRD